MSKIIHIIITLICCHSVFGSGTSTEHQNPFSKLDHDSKGVNLISGNVQLNHHLFTFPGGLSSENPGDFNDSTLNGAAQFMGVQGDSLPSFSTEVLSFSYSSNIHLNVHTRNDKAPTSWVGLGWRFDMGKISCDPMHTMPTTDDRCNYVSSNGVSHEIYLKNDVYYLENLPRWKVVPHYRLDGGGNPLKSFIIGWTIIDLSGNKLKFGDFDVSATPTVRSATNYTFAYEKTTDVKYVGEGLPNGAYDDILYPHEWKLSRKESYFGAFVDYTYVQTLEKLQSLGESSSQKYTKASYLDRIVTSEGFRAEFHMEVKGKKEFLDPKILQADPVNPGDAADAYMEHYEDSLLQRIEIYNGSNDKVREFQFCYGKLNQKRHNATGVEGSGHYVKSVLAKVVEYEYDGSLVEIGATEYDYWDGSEGRADNIPIEDFRTNKEYHWGALKSKKTPFCGLVTFDYKYKPLKDDFRSIALKTLIENNASKGIKRKYFMEGTYSGSKDGYKYTDRYANINWGTELTKNIEIKSSTLSSGEELFVLQTENYFFLILWNGEYNVINAAFDQDATDPNGGAIDNIFASAITVGEDVIVIQNSKVNDSYFGSSAWACKWHHYTTFMSWDNVNKKVVEDNSIYINTTQNLSRENSHDPVPDGYVFENASDYDNIFPMGKGLFCGIKYEESLGVWDNEWYKIYIIKRIVNSSGDYEWQTTKDVDKGYDDIEETKFQFEYPHLLVSYMYDELPKYDQKRARIYTWNGEHFKETYYKDDNDNEDTWRLGKNMLIHILEEGFVNHDDKISVYNWNGVSWDKHVNESMLEENTGIGNGTVSIQAIGDGYFAVKFDDGDNFRLVQWTGDYWLDVASQNVVNDDFDFFGDESEWFADNGPGYFALRTPNVIERYWFFDDVHPNANVALYNFVDNESWQRTMSGLHGHSKTSKRVIPYRDGFSFRKNDPLDSYIWNDYEWVKENRGRSLYKDQRLVNTSGFLEIGAETILHRKFMNSTVTPSYTFVVTQKEVFDPVINTTTTTRYTFSDDKSNYAIQHSNAMFNTVTVKAIGKQNDLGKMRYTYGTDLNVFNGRLLKVEAINDADEVVSSKEFHYESYQRDIWPESVYEIRNTRTKYVDNKVSKEVEYKYPYTTGVETSLYNGKPGEIRTDVNGTTLVTRIKYAYEYNQQLAVDNMFDAVAQTTNLSDNGTVKFLSANVTLWSNSLLTGKWVPSTWYDWSIENAVGNYNGFNFTPGHVNTDWRQRDTVSAYYGTGSIKESFSDNDKSKTLTNKDNITTHLYQNSGIYKYATIENGSYSDVAIFTGDYEDGSLDYFDTQNGWKKGGAILSDGLFIGANDRLGERSIYLASTNVGPNKTFTPNVTKNYLFTAWVYPIEVDVDKKINLLVKNNGSEVGIGDGYWPELTVTPERPLVLNQWQKISRIIPAVTLAAGNVTVAVSSVLNAKFYVEDIRFAPVDAYVNTYYYDNIFRLPIAQADKNGVGYLTEYDNAKRVVKTLQEVDGSGKIIVTDNSYIKKPCEIGVPSGDLLFDLEVDGVPFAFQPSKFPYSENIDNLLEEALVTLYFSPDDQVSYDNGSGTFSGICCTDKTSFPVDLSTTPTTIRVRVNNNVANTYTIVLDKSMVAWNNVGTAKISSGYSNYVSISNEMSNPEVLYADSRLGNKVVAQGWDGSLWQNHGPSVSLGQTKGLSVKYDGSTPFASFTQETLVTDAVQDGTQVRARTYTTYKASVKKYNGVDWVNASATSDVSEGLAEHLAFDIHPTNGNLYVAFVGDATKEEGLSFSVGEKIKRLYVKRLDGSTWTKLGDRPVIPASPSNIVYFGDGTPDGVVSLDEVLDIDLKVNSTGDVYVSYIVNKKIQIPDGNGGVKDGTDRRVILTKKYHSGNEHWGTIDAFDNSDFLGSLEADDFAAPMVDHFVLDFYNNQPVIAAKHQTYEPYTDSYGSGVALSENYIVSVYSYDKTYTNANGHHWFALPNGPTSKDIELFLQKDVDDFDFSVNSGVPYLAFHGFQNNDRLSVIKWNGTDWKSVGNPAFTSLANTNAKKVSFGKNGGVETVGILKTDKFVSVLDYNSTGDKDLTLSSMDIKGIEGTTLHGIDYTWNYKPYILNYQATAKMNSNTNIARFSFAASNLADVGKVYILNEEDEICWAKSAGQCDITNEVISATPASLNLPLYQGKNTYKVVVYPSSGAMSPLTYNYAITKKQSVGLPGLGSSIDIKLDGITPITPFDPHNPSNPIIFPLDEVNDDGDGDGTYRVYPVIFNDGFVEYDFERYYPGDYIIIDISECKPNCSDTLIIRPGTPGNSSDADEPGGSTLPGDEFIKVILEPDFTPDPLLVMSGVEIEVNSKSLTYSPTGSLTIRIAKNINMSDLEIVNINGKVVEVQGATMTSVGHYPLSILPFQKKIDVVVKNSVSDPSPVIYPVYIIWEDPIVVVAGIYEIQNIHSNRCVEVDDASLDDGANVQQFDCNTTHTQRWEVSYIGKGYYQFKNLNSGKFLDVADFGKGSNVQQWGPNSWGDHRKWKIEEVTEGVYTLQPKSNEEKCLDVVGRQIPANINVQVYDCNETEAQSFRFNVVNTDPVDFTGIYEIRNNVSNLCVDVVNGSQNEAANVQQFTCNNTNAQRWEFTDLGNDEYQVKNVNSGRVLDVAWGGVDANVQQWQYVSTGPSQKWTVEYTGNGTYALIPQSKTTECLTIAGGSEHAGANVEAHHCNKDGSQRFELIDKSNEPVYLDGVYEIRNNISNKCVDVDGASYSDGANVRQWDCNQSNAQYWIVDHLGSDVYSLTNKNSGKYLDVSWGGQSENVHQWGNSSPGSSQQWKFKDAGNGTYTLTPLTNSIECLDIEGAATWSGANIRSVDCNGTDAQKFEFVH
ncbi:MAG: RICIN domain-containing protein [Fibrobacterales bacterium]